MPYWDLSVDGEYWLNAEDPKVEDLPIYNSNVGGEGDISNDYCVSDAPWSMEYYDTDTLCADDEVAEHCCLKRFHEDGTGSLYSRSDFAEFVYSEDTSNFTEYVLEISTVHGKIHEFFGSPEGTHFHPTRGSLENPEGEPAEDPMFALFHAFIDYIQMLRADCNQYDVVSADDLDGYVPWAYSEYGGCGLDYLMDFSVLCEEGTDRFCTYNSVTPRVMFDLSPNNIFNIVYELGDFWHQSEELHGLCADSMNSTWWHDGDNADGAVFTTKTNVRLLYLDPSKALDEAMVFIVIAIAALAMLKWYGWPCAAAKKLDEEAVSEGDGIYGSI